MTQPAIAQRIYARDIDLAERYGVSRNTIWRWTKEGRLPAPTRLGPSCTRWRLGDIEAWEAERERKAS